MNEYNELGLKEMWPVMEEQLNEGKSVSFRPGGISMLPLIRPEVDTVVIKKVPDKLKKFDLSLYRRADGSFVLHRIVGVKKDKYITRGDNQNIREGDIKREQILAIAVGMYKNGEYISFSGVKYWIYCRIRYMKQELSRVKRVLKTYLKKVKKF